jgi:quercetin dioxygenase-like cupin family protein
MGDADHAVSEPKCEEDLGRARDERADAHLATLTTTGLPQCKTQGGSIVWKCRSGDIERGKHDPRRKKEEAVIRSGQTIENPVTGERITFLKTARETSGEYVLVEAAVAPGGGVASHVHPYQTEEFEVLSGSLEFRKDGDKVVAGDGDSVTVDPGTVHRFKNIGEDEARFIARVSPALEFESFLETMFALAADGKTNKKGMPNPVRMAVIANAYFDDVRAPLVPGAIQKAALAAGAAVGRLLGYQPAYVPTPAVQQPATAAA